MRLTPIGRLAIDLVIAVFVTLFAFGGIIPTLISSPSNIGVIVGFALFIAYVFAAAHYAIGVLPGRLRDIEQDQK